MTKMFTISPSPHVKSDESIRKIMYGVVMAMIPAMIMSFIFFGLDAVKVTAVAVTSCMLFEYLLTKFIVKAEPSLADGSAVITGMLLAFNLPAAVPIWLVILGAFIAIAVGKVSFGGLGQNPFNPALVGRVFLLISFPVQMTTWPSNLKIDAESGATPLALLKQAVDPANNIVISDLISPSNYDLFCGNIAGSMGEISAMALILGGLYMLWKRIITWHIPVSILGTMFLVQGALWFSAPETYASPVFHILAGGAMLGAIFMATDMVTSPMSTKGQIIFGVGIAVITLAIRNFGAYPEGISFAILIMNAFTPLINTYVKPKRFGGKING